MYGCGKSKTTPSANAERPETSIQYDSTRPTTKLKLLEESELPSARVQIWEAVDELPKPIAIFQHVFWEPADTNSFRQMLAKTDLVKAKSVLEIGTGSGLIALCCLQHKARKVVATDINPWAQKNAIFNAKALNLDGRLEVRLVSQKTPDAWSVIGPAERFDVIFSNPPWQPGKPIHVQDFAFYDPDFQLLKSFLEDLPAHLKPGGRAFLAYGCVEAVNKLKALATAKGFQLKVHDERDLNELPSLFLPGMLIEVVVP